MKTDLNILMLEDDPFDAELNKSQLLLLENYNCIVHWVTNKESYQDAIQSFIPDIVISDYNIPQYNGIKALNDLKEIQPLIPFIFVTGAIDEETAAGTIKAGAWDYVVKDRLFRLPLAIRGALQLKEERVNTARVEAKNRQLSMAIEQSPVHIVISNTDHKIEYINAKLTEITGFTPEDVIGKDLAMFVPDSNKKAYHKFFQKALEEYGTWRGEVQSLKKDGTLFWENLSISPIKNEQGTITHYISIKEDITKRKQMEQELINALDKAECSDKLKDAFLRNLSHEIRTPLNAIVGFSKLLTINGVTPTEMDEYTSIIINSSNQLLSIVNDVLTVSRIQTGQEVMTIKPIPINSIVDNLYVIFTLQAEAKSLELSISKEVNDLSFTILTDETKLTQILSNLLNNAVKFTNTGSIEFGYTIRGNEIEFFVKDTGIGISKESQEVIFERFRQAETSISRTFGGTGLGLSISKAFAEMLNGSIRVDSEPGKGSTFYFSMPLEESDEKQQKPTSAIEIPQKAYTILVAEDEIYNYQLIEAFLKDLNCNLINAKDGNEAVELCQKNTKIDIVLMDIKMPNMDGVTAFKEIRKFRTALPIIVQTAYALEPEKQQLLSVGFDDYISKPIDSSELIKKVLKFLPTN